ncbi:MAG: EpsG family protein [Methanobrevibacter sp.]|jgi:hypothetical protein|nr:EpsG family protein [Candidatus Methanovirga basalitermitum]
MELAYLVYTVIFVVTLFFAYAGIKRNDNFHKITSRKTWFFWGIAIAFYTVILGLRKDVGIDYVTYKGMFEVIDAFTKTDVIYFLFTGIVKNYHYNYFIALLAFVPICFVFLFFKDKIKFLMLFLFFYFTWGIMFDSLNIMRQIAACTIIVYAVTKYLDKDYVKFIIFTILALCFHRSSLSVLPFIFLFRFDFTKSRRIILCLLVFSFVFGQNIYNQFLFPVLNKFFIAVDVSSGYSIYLENFDLYSERGLILVESGTGLFNIFNLFVVIYAVFFSEILKEKYKRYNFNLYYNFMIVGTVCYNIFRYHEMLNRMCYYFMYFRLIVFAVLFYYLLFVQENTTFKLLCVGIMLFGVVNYYYQIYMCSQDIAPFRFIL